MRVLQVNHNYHVAGGSDRVFCETSALLRSAGHAVVPFCIANQRNQASQWSDYFPVAANSAAPSAGDALRYFYNREARRNLDRLLIRTGAVDVAHLHIYNGKQTPAILPVLRRRGIAIVHSLHEYKLACPVYTLQRHGQNCDRCVAGSVLNCLQHRCKNGSALWSLVMTAERLTSRWLGDVWHVDRFICVSDFQRRVMARAGIPSAKLVTLHNFVETGDSQAAGIDDGYLLYFGRIERLKGLTTLIAAVERTGQPLVIAGDGSWCAQLRARIAGLHNVSFVGFQSGPRLQALITKSRAVAVPSEWYENCPMSVLEAKACGKPVIGARIGGIPELVRHGLDGFLFAPGDADDLARVLGVFEQCDLAALGQRARRDAERRFSPAAHLQALTEIYAAAGATEPQMAVVQPG